jgi:hypothetical protein
VESLVTRLHVASDSIIAPINLPEEMARAAAAVEQALDILLPPVEGAEGRLAASECVPSWSWEVLHFSV